jgi:hypothetical protein
MVAKPVKMGGRKMGRLAKHLIPAEYLAEHGGQLVAGGRVRCVVAEDLGALNRGLRVPGGWFTEEQLFFATGVRERDDVPDYFYIDARDSEPRPVRYFHLHPTDVGVCAEEFTQGRWNLVSNRG